MRALLPVEEIDACMHLFVCLCVCIFNIYIYIKFIHMYQSVCLSVCLSAFLAGCLSVCLCASQPVLSVCLSYLSFLSYPYLPDSSFLCVLSVFYSYLYIIYIYTMPRFLPIVSIVLLSHQHLPNSSIYLSIDLRIYILFYQILFNPMHPIYPTMPCIYPVSIHLMRTVLLDRKSRPSSLILFFKHPTPAI
jgi:hypothetical protein